MKDELRFSIDETITVNILIKIIAKFVTYAI